MPPIAWMSRVIFDNWQRPRAASLGSPLSHGAVMPICRNCQQRCSFWTVDWGSGCCMKCRGRSPAHQAGRGAAPQGAGGAGCLVLLLIFGGGSLFGGRGCSGQDRLSPADKPQVSFPQPQINPPQPVILAPENGPPRDPNWRPPGYRDPVAEMMKPYDPRPVPSQVPWPGPGQPAVAPLPTPTPFNPSQFLPPMGPARPMGPIQPQSPFLPQR